MSAESCGVEVAVLEEQADGGLADEDQADAGGEAFEEGGLDALAEDGFEAVAVVVEGVGAEAGEDRGRQRDGEDAEGELVEELRPGRARAAAPTSIG